MSSEYGPHKTIEGCSVQSDSDAVRCKSGCSEKTTWSGYENGGFKSFSGGLLTKRFIVYDLGFRYVPGDRRFRGPLEEVRDTWVFSTGRNRNFRHFLEGTFKSLKTGFLYRRQSTCPKFLDRSSIWSGYEGWKEAFSRGLSFLSYYLLYIIHFFLHYCHLSSVTQG